MKLDHALLAAAEALANARLVVLFGSRAHGNPRPDGDVDIAVELLDDSSAARNEAIQRCAAASHRELDIVFVQDAGPQLRFEIARGGRLLFERSPRLWERFKTAAMIDWWDWQPTADMIHWGLIARLREKVASTDGA